MKFINIIPKTLFDRSFYKQVISGQTRDSIKFYLKVGALIAFVIMFFSSVTALPSLQFFIKESKQWVLEEFPDDLSIEIKDGKAISSYETAFVLPIKSSENALSKSFEERGEKPKANFITIDTSRDITLEEFIQSDSIAFLSQNYLIHFEDKSVKFNPLEKFPNFKFDKKVLQKIIGYGSFLSFFLPLMFFAGVMMSFAFGLFWILIITLVYKLITKMMGRHLLFLDAFKVCVYAATVPAILDITFFYSGIQIPFFFTFATLIVALINTKNEPVQEELPLLEDK